MAKTRQDEQVELEQYRIVVGTGQSVAAILYRASEHQGALLALAHGAGAGQSSPFIRDFASGLGQRGIDVLTFNFPTVRRSGESLIAPRYWKPALKELSNSCRRSPVQGTVFSSAESRWGDASPHKLQPGSVISSPGWLSWGIRFIRPGNPGS